MAHDTVCICRTTGADIGEQRSLPIGVLRLTNAVTEPETGAVATPARRERTVPHQAAQEDFPLEFRETMGHGLQDAVSR